MNVLNTFLPIITGIFIGVIVLIFGFLFKPTKIAKITSFLILGFKIYSLVLRYKLGESAIELLPLHLCNITLIFCIFMMFFKSNTFFQISYFWSIGAIFAIITPDISYPPLSLLTFEFFITHFFIIFSIIYAVLYFKFRPTFLGFVSSFIILNLAAVGIYFINLRIGTNYLYINRMPTFVSPLNYFGEWPFYILVVEGIYIILTYILYRILRRTRLKFQRTTLNF